MSRPLHAIVIAICLRAIACVGHAPAPKDPVVWRPLGESTASAGANASRKPPLSADDPVVLDVSRPTRARARAMATQPPALPNRDTATSSTNVEIPRDIAPRSTTEVHDQKGVFSAPPPPPGYR